MGFLGSVNPYLLIFGMFHLVTLSLFIFIYMYDISGTTISFHFTVPGMTRIPGFSPGTVAQKTSLK